MCFSDFIPDVIMRNNIGWGCILIVSSHLFGHIFFMAKDNIMKLKMHIVRCRKHRTHRLQIEQAKQKLAE